MRPHSTLRHRSRAELHAPRQTQLVLGSRWQGPTIREFVERVETEYGASTDLIGLLRDGVSRNDSLAPSDVRELCSLLGVPAEDFGV